MGELKLGRLPDRTPIKLTISVGAELHQALRRYAELYEAAYGTQEQLADLVPYMVDSFLQSDKAFVSDRRNRTRT